MTPPYDAHTATITAVGRLDGLRHSLDRVLRRCSLPLLRVSLGVIFIWFGALKIADATPVKALVADTVPWVNPDWFVPILGGFEALIGVALIVGYRLGWVCAAMVAHLAGTFLTVVMQPSLMFREGNPLLLTMEGEFVAKNLVLITGALVVAAWSRRLPPAAPASQAVPAGPAATPSQAAPVRPAATPSQAAPAGPAATPSLEPDRPVIPGRPVTASDPAARVEPTGRS